MNPAVWTAVAEAGATAIIAGGVVLGGLRLLMGRSFVTHAEHHAMGARVTAVETRVGGLETSHAALAATLTETKEGVKRVEHQTTLLVTHLLNREQRDEG